MKKSLPWWNYGHVWMVIAGPAIVVVAGFVTLYLAISHPDPVQASYYTQGQVKGAVAELPPTQLVPAELARNHAQTGVPEKLVKPAH
ncbi:FixH family protein [Tibeticola sp.]|jgi:hypothetical protein|uniref:FixH family protein n=1 Tax=Tibeticola sp. TaxID=2005368 RepID=UPI0025D634E8|nr:FixH family protein [Tibeticola sp.]